MKWQRNRARQNRWCSTCRNRSNKTLRTYIIWYLISQTGKMTWKSRKRRSKKEKLRKTKHKRLQKICLQSATRLTFKIHWNKPRRRQPKKQLKRKQKQARRQQQIRLKRTCRSTSETTHRCLITIVLGTSWRRTSMKITAMRKKWKVRFKPRRIQHGMKKRSQKHKQRC